MNTDDPIKKAQEVMKLIPHRYPFLLVDRILSYDSENLVAIKSVSINEPFFQGHFPDRPNNAWGINCRSYGTSCKLSCCFGKRE